MSNTLPIFASPAVSHHGTFARLRFYRAPTSRPARVNSETGVFKPKKWQQDFVEKEFPSAFSAASLRGSGPCGSDPQGVVLAPALHPAAGAFFESRPVNRPPCSGLRVPSVARKPRCTSLALSSLGRKGSSPLPRPF